MSNQSLLVALIEKQGTSSGRAFAHKLGVAPSVWSDTRRTRIPLGIAILGTTAYLFPDLKDHLFEHLRALGKARLEGA